MNELTFLGRNYRHETAIFDFGIEHEKKAFQRAWSLIKQDDIIFDIGAQYGVWTLPAAVMKPKHVYAFEPYSKFFDELKENIECNEDDIKNRITPVNIGFDRRKRHNVPYSEEQVSIMNGEHKDKQIDVTTLDRYFSENNIEKVNHIKIDVDGPELNILKGGQEVLKRFRPNIAIEEHNAIIKNISISIYKFLVFDLKIPYSIESIPINGGDNTSYAYCRHTLFYI